MRVSCVTGDAGETAVQAQYSAKTLHGFYKSGPCFHNASKPRAELAAYLAIMHRYLNFQIWLTVFTAVLGSQVWASEVPIVTAPVANSTVTAPVSVIASCPMQGADSIQVYLDDKAIYSENGTTMNYSLAATSGSHKINIKCWVGPTPYATGDFNITVSGSGGGGGNVPVVTAPVANSTVTAPVSVIASCPMQGANSIQVYLDDKAVYSENGTTMNYSLAATSGSHKINIKCWVGPTPYATGDFNITVSGSGGGGGGTVGGSAFDIPAGAWTSDALDQCPMNASNGTCGNSYWQEWDDVRSNGTASETFSHVTEDARLSAMFDFTHDNYGDILNHLSTAYVNVSAKNFVYDVWVQVQDVSGLQVLEFGINHAITSGRVLFPGVQCNFAGDGHWDVNGFGSNPWVESVAPCSASAWEMNWHHIKLALSVYYGANASEDRSYVNALYDGTMVNGVEQGTTYNLNMDGGTQNFAYEAGLVTAKFQIGGASGTQSSTTWISNLLISAW